MRGLRPWYYFGNTLSNRQKTATDTEGTGYQEFNIDNLGSHLTTNENLVIVGFLERCFIERINREMGNNVGTVQDRIQNAILTAINSNITPKVELAVRSINASSGQDATSVFTNSGRGQHIRIISPFENVSERNNTLHVPFLFDETRSSSLDKVKELLVPGSHFDRHPHIHHIYNLLWSELDFYYEINQHSCFHLIAQF